MSIFKKKPDSPSQIPAPSSDADILNYGKSLIFEGRTQCENVMSFGQNRLKRIQAARRRLRGIS